MNSFRNLTRYAERRLVATSSTVQYAWFTGWMTADGVDNVRAVLKAKNASGSSFNWQLAIQYAPVRIDEPGAPATLATAQTGSAEYQTGDVSVASNAASSRFFRLGIAYWATANTGVQQSDVGLIASWKSVATFLGRSRVTLAAVDTGTKYEVLTGWVPATFMSKIKAVFMLNSITGATSNLRYQLAYQTAGTSVQQPSGWVAAEQGFTTPSSTYNERNTGEIAISTTEMWIRLGVAYGMTTGVDVNVTAVLDAICSCR